MALSAWGMIPDDLEIDFPTMWAPDAKEIAEIAERKTNAVLAVYQNDLIDSATAQQELQELADETGMWSKISEESIKAGEGQTYSSSRMMADPMAGLTYLEDPDRDMDISEENEEGPNKNGKEEVE